MTILERAMLARSSDDEKTQVSTSAELGTAPELSTGAVPKQYNVALHTLRFYEGSGLSQSPHKGLSEFSRTRNCQCLAMMLRRKQLGYAVAEIRALLQSREDEVVVPLFEARLSSDELLSKVRVLERRCDNLDRIIHDLRERHIAACHHQKDSPKI